MYFNKYLKYKNKYVIAKYDGAPGDELDRVLSRVSSHYSIDSVGSQSNGLEIILHTEEGETPKNVNNPVLLFCQRAAFPRLSTII